METIIRAMAESPRHNHKEVLSLMIPVQENNPEASPETLRLLEKINKLYNTKETFVSKQTPTATHPTNFELNTGFALTPQLNRMIDKLSNQIPARKEQFSYLKQTATEANPVLEWDVRQCLEQVNRFSNRQPLTMDIEGNATAQAKVTTAHVKKPSVHQIRNTDNKSTASSQEIVADTTTFIRGSKSRNQEPNMYWGTSFLCAVTILICLVLAIIVLKKLGFTNVLDFLFNIIN